MFSKLVIPGGSVRQIIMETRLFDLDMKLVDNEKDVF